METTTLSSGFSLRSGRSRTAQRVVGSCPGFIAWTNTQHLSALPITNVECRSKRYAESYLEGRTLNNTRVNGTQGQTSRQRHHMYLVWFTLIGGMRVAFFDTCYSTQSVTPIRGSEYQPTAWHRQPAQTEARGAWP